MHASPKRPVILHVPYTYFPDPCGGTEVYVRGLAQHLAARGYRCLVAAPGKTAAAYEDAGLQVYRFQADLRRRLALAYGEPDGIAAQGFRDVVAKTAPGIVHLHARTAAVSERLVDIAHEAGAKVVLTYHTPTVSCPRGTMMLYGRTSCDGIVGPRRCTACTLFAQGVPLPLARLAAAVPSAVSRRASALAIETKPFSTLRIPGLVAGAGQRFFYLVSKVDHVVAVCQWAYDVLERNGVPPGKLTLSRQGISNVARRPARVALEDPSGPLRIAYFGRIDHAKGPDLLARALPLIPGASVQIDIYGVHQPGSERDIAWLKAEAKRDKRLRVMPAVPPADVISVMASYDLVAIPSRWLETGPLVALEAFAASVPVIGARLGGILELVRDGVDGVLVEPDDPAAWAAVIAQLSSDRRRVCELRAEIVPPRTMDAAADDMVAVYSNRTIGIAPIAGRPGT